MWLICREVVANASCSVTRIGRILLSMPRDDEVWRFGSDVRNQNAKLLVGALAARQVGRIRHDQVRAFGVGKATIARWHEDGYLYPVLPRVYGVGHPGTSPEADLASALLYAGAGSMLSHGTAVWWLELLKYPPPQIHVSTPRRIRSIENIVVHDRRTIRREWHKGLPVTSPSQAILDFAATNRHRLLRLVLANADHDNLLDTRALQRLIGQGIAGTAALNHALGIHLPQLADTRSDGEVDLVLFCETQNIPIPEVNVYLYGHLVDAVWREQKLVVEVDGHRGHRTPAQLYANHQRDLVLRSNGFTVLRYAKRQFRETPIAVAADINRHLI